VPDRTGCCLISAETSTTFNLAGRSFLKEADFAKTEFTELIDFAERLRADKRAGREVQRLIGRNIVLIFEKTSARTRSAFEVGAHDQGGHVTYLGPGESQIGHKESIKDTARVLGRMFDGIEYRGAAHENVEVLARYAGVPVWNGLTDTWHPTQMLADILTMRDHSPKPITDVAYCYLGDAHNNTANSLLVTGALLGADVRIAAPEARWPASEVREIADRLANESGARLTVTSDAQQAVVGVDFLYTDVWLSMGEPEERWGERIKELLPYQVNAALVRATGNPDVKFLHCLPALHNRETAVGEEIFERYGFSALEVTEEVFESKASIVFDQAENRLHTIKAILVATLGD
jgi:ornithine carbamoyltransferase